jgi:hypothetical protein
MLKLLVLGKKQQHSTHQHSHVVATIARRLTTYKPHDLEATISHASIVAN